MEPPLSELLTNNDPPSETTIQELRRRMLTPLTELAGTDSEIAQLEARLHAFHTKRNVIQNLIKEYTTILSPIRRLPADILREIFHHCLPVQRYPILSSIEAPTLLMHVSRTWRFVVLSTPRLWAQLRITFSEDFLTDSRLPADANERRVRVAQILQLRCNVVKYWLSLSGTCPLSISICYTVAGRAFAEEEAFREDDLTIKLFMILRSHMHRWENIELSLPIKIYRRFEALFIEDSLPTLADLKLNLYGQQGEFHDRIKLLHAPKLKKVSIFGFQPTGDFNNWPVDQWAQRLTSLCLHGPVILSHCLGLLKVCVKLVQCKLYLYGDPTGLQSTEVISLPRLRALSLIVKNVQPITLKRFYDEIDAPHLKYFEYDQDEPLDMFGTRTIEPTFISLLQKSAELEKLTLHKKMPVLHWRTVLEAVSPTLTRLVIGPEPQGPLRYIQRKDYSRFNSLRPMPTQFDLGILVVEKTSLDLTATANPQTVLLPNLKVLEVTSEGTRITDNELIRFITSRMDPRSSTGAAVLQYVKVIFPRVKQIDVGEAVEQFRESRTGAGEEVALPKLDLDYLLGEPFKHPDPLSTSYELSKDGRSWNPPYADIENWMIPPC